MIAWFCLMSALASEPSEVGIRYVMLVDRGGYVDSHSSPGADIDALGVLRAGEVVAWATRVVKSDIGAGSFGNQVTDASKALGPVDHPPSSLEGFVALGGLGHFLVLELGAPTQAGDRLEVHEVGRVGGRAEPVEVCVSSSPQGPWTSVGSGWGRFSVPLVAAPTDPESLCVAPKLT